MSNPFTLRAFIKKIKYSNKSFKYKAATSKKFCLQFSSMLYNKIYNTSGPTIPLKYNSKFFKFHKTSSNAYKLKLSSATPIVTKNYSIRTYSYNDDTFETWDVPLLNILFSKMPIYKSYRYSFESRLINYMSHNYLVNEPKGNTLWIEKMLKEITLGKNDVFLQYIKKHMSYLKKNANYKMFEEMHYNIVLSLFKFNKKRQYNTISQDSALRRHLDMIKKKIAFPHITTQAMISSMYACNIPYDTIESAISYICWETTFHDLIPQPSQRPSKTT